MNEDVKMKPPLLCCVLLTDFESSTVDTFQDDESVRSTLFRFFPAPTTKLFDGSCWIRRRSFGCGLAKASSKKARQSVTMNSSSSSSSNSSSPSSKNPNGETTSTTY